jgi:hypothetical protein
LLNLQELSSKFLARRFYQFSYVILSPWFRSMNPGRSVSTRATRSTLAANFSLQFAADRMIAANCSKVAVFAIARRPLYAPGDVDAASFVPSGYRNTQLWQF